MMDFMHRVVATSGDWTGLVLRITLAVMIFPHAAQKVFGWFGGGGIKGTMGYLTGSGLPSIVALLVIAFEFLGSFMLFTGFGTRVAAAMVGCVMLGAMLKVHLPNGFFMNWHGSAKGEGIEFFLLALGIVTALILNGGGKFAADSLLCR